MISFDIFFSTLTSVLFYLIFTKTDKKTTLVYRMVNIKWFNKTKPKSFLTNFSNSSQTLQKNEQEGINVNVNHEKIPPIFVLIFKPT